MNWNAVTAGEKIYLNEIEIIKLETTAPEYQYHLKDHLGNVRMTFTTKEDVETNKATMEAENENTEYSQFSRYEDVRKVRSALFDHTNNTNPTSTDGQSIRLSGNANEKTGLVKTLSVMPGDVIHMKAYAKYVDRNNTDWSTALNNLITAIGAVQSGTVIDGSKYLTEGATPFPYTGMNGTNTSTGLGPKAYLNYIMFDRDYTANTEDHSQTGFVRVTEAAKENGQTNQADLINGVPHELLEATITVKQAGYLYIYLSNEESSPVEVFFDDFEVVHTKGPVVQSEEYYPFGLTFNGYQKENGVSNRWRFQGQEHVDDLGLGWDSFKWRNHQPEIGRFFGIDKLSEKYYYNSPYAFSENKVVAHRELEGLESSFSVGNQLFREAGYNHTPNEATARATWNELGNQQLKNFATLAFLVAPIGDLAAAGGLAIASKFPAAGRMLGMATETAATVSKVEGAVATEAGQATEASGASTTLSFSQTTASPMFSKEGAFSGKSINEVAVGLRAGNISPENVPIAVVNGDGTKLIVNTRSSLALKQANIPQPQWNLIDVTDPAAAANMAQRLSKNGLTNKGTDTIRITGSGSNASTLVHP